ncbi:MAG: hypothetical protein WAU71_02645 [Pyrinomonadaceae bacterium]
MIATAVGIAFLVAISIVVWYMWPVASTGQYRYVSTAAGTNKEFGEPFGIAVKNDSIYVSDGQNDKIWKIDGGNATVFAEGLDTPSGIAFDKDGNLIVADTGSHTIKSINAKGEISVIAGSPGQHGFADGDADSSLFNAPIGVAVGPDGKVFVADTYNDRIRVISGGQVTTMAGSSTGFANGTGQNAKFDTPSGIAIWQDKVLVADTGNRRIRVIEADGRVWTLAGTGDGDLKDGLLSSSSFVQPTAISVGANGAIFVADGNAIRRIGGTTIPTVTTLSAKWRGVADGFASRSRFNRPSGLAIAQNGDLIVADSENRLVRRFSVTDKGSPISAEQIAELRDKPDEFRDLQPPRWPYDPPSAKRDIAGTLGEIRGLMTASADNIWFHNGLDIAGAYGETARFIRDEKVLRPIAAENFGTLRELIRMPTLGYIHIRLGRNQASVPFVDDRFQFQRDALGKLTGIRVPRGSKFKAGDPIGTLNAMNHIHLIAGRSGSEMNALDALAFPGISDSRSPAIEKVEFYAQNWNPIETVPPNSRIRITGKTRIVIRAYDQMDGNSERRRLGLYKLGFQVLLSDKGAIPDQSWTIRFDRMPPNEAVPFIYADGSHSGATGETIFRYIVSNFLEGDEFREAFLDPADLAAGNHTVRIFAADYFGNMSSKDIEIEVIK